MELWSGAAGVVIGWLLAQASDLLAGWHVRKKIKIALLDELRELNEALNNSWFQWSRSLQMISAGRVDNSVPLPLAHFIFSNHYKEAALGMNRDQRRSMQMIHAHVDQLNADTLEYRDFLVKLHEPSMEPVELTDSLDKKVRDDLKGMLFRVRMIQWHIWYHFEHPMLPDLAPGTPAHKNYVRYLEKVREEIKEIERQGTTVDPKRFDEIYTPEYFDRIPDE